MHQPEERAGAGLPHASGASPRHRGGRHILVGAAILLCLGCGGDPTGPLDPARSGFWRGPGGVDTWGGFTLQQRGTVVTGTHDFFSAVFSSTTHVPVGGTADPPQVVLHWREGSDEIIASGVLSADSMSLTFTDSVA